MTILFLLIPLAMLLAGLFLAAFIWGARAGQLDDLDTPAIRMLYDDEPVRRGPQADGEDTN